MEYARALKSSRALSERAKLYQSVRGVGQLTAATLVANCRNWVKRKAGE